MLTENSARWINGAEDARVLGDVINPGRADESEPSKGNGSKDIGDLGGAESLNQE